MLRLAPFADDILIAVAVLVVVLLLAPGLLPWAVLAVLLYSGLKVWLFRAHLRRPAIGVEAMVGRVATALEDLQPRGQVDLDGERWDAVCTAPARQGERVRVEAVEGLQLRVAPVGVAGGSIEQARPSWLLAAARWLRRP